MLPLAHLFVCFFLAYLTDVIEPTVAPEQTKGKRNTNNLLLEQA